MEDVKIAEAAYCALVISVAVLDLNEIEIKKNRAVRESEFEKAAALRDEQARILERIPSKANLIMLMDILKEMIKE